MDFLKFQTKRIIKHPFFSGSFIMIVGSNIANVFAYVYHIIFGRYLDVAAYGNLSAFLALLGLLGTVLGFIGLVIVKFVASTKDEDIAALMRWFAEKTAILVVVIIVFLIVFSRNIATSLKMPYEMVLLVAPTFAVMSIIFIQRSFLQGLMNFKLMAIVNNISLFFRILLGLVFVYMGLSAFGASLGVITSMILGSAISWLGLRKYNIFKIDKKFTLGKKVINYAFPMFIASVGTTALLNIDLILVKYYFSPEVAGQYAAVSVLGKIIFYATAPIGSVMFPMIASRFAEGKNYILIFILSLLLSTAAGVGVTGIYFLFPNLAILPLYGSRYLEIAGYIGYYAIFIMLFSVSNLIVNFYQSIDRPQIGLLLPLAVVAQVFSIYLFHDSLYVVIQNLIVVMAATTVTLSIYFILDKNRAYEKAK